MDSEMQRLIVVLALAIPVALAVGISLAGGGGMLGGGLVAGSVAFVVNFAYFSIRRRRK